MGAPIRCAPGTNVVAMDCSFAQSNRQIGFIVALGCLRFVGEPTLVQPIQFGTEREEKGVKYALDT
jgi:hypothetical protein